MKKLLFIIVALMVGVTAQAQLQGVQPKRQGTQTLAYAGHNKVRLKLLKEDRDSLYYIDMISSNRYDSDTYFFLGEKLAPAIRTVVDLIKVCDDLKHRETLEVKNLGNKCNILALELFGEKRLFFIMYNNIGTVANAGTLAGVSKDDLIYFYKILSGEDYSKE